MQCLLPMKPLNFKVLMNLISSNILFFWSSSVFQCLLVSTLLHFVTFFWVASLVFIEVDNVKALKLDNRMGFFIFTLPPNAIKHHKIVVKNTLKCISSKYRQ